MFREYASDIVLHDLVGTRVLDTANLSSSAAVDFQVPNSFRQYLGHLYARTTARAAWRQPCGFIFRNVAVVRDMLTGGRRRIS